MSIIGIYLSIGMVLGVLLLFRAENTNRDISVALGIVMVLVMTISWPYVVIKTFWKAFKA